MHECEALLPKISLQLDGRLSDAEQLHLDHELENCPECMALYRAMIDVDSRLRATPIIAPLRDFSFDVIVQLQRHHQREKRVLGITLAIGSLLSLWPIAVGMAIFLFALYATMNPAVLTNTIDFLNGISAGLGAVMVAVSTLSGTVSPLVLPFMFLAISVSMLTLTLLWALRDSQRPHPNRAKVLQ